MSVWDACKMEEKIFRILDVQSHEPEHHFGRPFMTPYQIAIAFKKMYPAEFENIGKPLGGRNIGQHDSLAQYIALELSRRIRDGNITNVEGRFLHRQNLRTLKYDDNGTEIESSLMQSYDLSMFRRID